MDKKEVLKESVKRLLELGITDKEIIENLKSVGVKDDLAKEILQETHDELSGRKPARPKEEDVKKPNKEKKLEAPSIYADEGDLYSRIYKEAEEELDKTPVLEKPIKNPGYSSPKISIQDDQSLAELWNKGIMATVDSKLEEMESIKNEINSVIDSKVEERIKGELKRIESGMESQRKMFFDKIESHLEAKSEEILRVVKSKAEEMEDLHEKVQTDVSKAQGEKAFNSELLNNIDDKLKDLEGIKSRMISETQSSVMRMESKFEDFMAQSTSRQKEAEVRINRALQLESKITEGLVADAKQKMDSLKLAKENELKADIQAEFDRFNEKVKKVDAKGIIEKLAQLKELEKSIIERQKELDSMVEAKVRELDEIYNAKEKQIDSYLQDKSKEIVKDYSSKVEKIDAYLSEELDRINSDMSSFKEEVSRVRDENIEELNRQYGADVDELFAKNLEIWNDKLKEKEEEIEGLKEKIDIDKFNAMIDSLELFKKQFLNQVEKSISDYNKTKKELADSIIQRDKAINDYLRRIDAKMKELNSFEKKFSKEISSLIDKIPDKPRLSKENKQKPSKPRGK